MEKLTIVVPVYYNEKTLFPLFEKLLALEDSLKLQCFLLELIFVEDGSGDHSWEELLSINKSRPDLVKLIRLSRNFGSYNAIKLGLQYVTGDCFCYLSADLQDPPELILEMIRLWKKGSRYVICERNTREDPIISLLFARLYYFLLRRLVIPNYPKGGFDLSLMDKVMLPYLRDCGKNVNLHVYGYYLGFKPTVIEYHREKRQHGKSRWTFAKKFNLFLDSILGFSRIFIRLISMIGIITSFIGFLYGIYILITAFSVGFNVRGFSTIVALVVFFSGLIIFMLGVISEYIWRIYDQVNHRPSVVVSEIIE